MSNKYKQQIKRYKKAPVNKETDCLFFTTKTSNALSLTTTNKGSVIAFLSTFFTNGDQHDEITVDQIKLLDVFISDLPQQQLFMNQFAVLFESEKLASAVKRALIGAKDTMAPTSVNAAFTVAPQEEANDSGCGKNEHIELSEASEVPGLILIKDFITEQQEAHLLDCIANQVTYNDNLKSRQVKHYGFEFDYNTRRINPLKPIEKLPEWTLELSQKIANDCQLFVPDQLTINEYLPGQGIKPHIDTHSPFEDGICSLSLLSDIVMNFTNPETNEKKHVLADRRSLVIMTGESRYLWRHGIHCRKCDVLSDGRVLNRSKRISLTFRKIRTPIASMIEAAQSSTTTTAADIAKMFPPCQCQWPKYCDSQSDSSLVFLPYKTDIKPSVLENEYVVKFYDTVAVHWDHTRHSPWPSVSKFISDQPEQSLFADVGCGNGKYLRVIEEHNCYYVASDRSEKLAEVCSEKYGYDVGVADATYLPYRSNVFDAVINIAVMHHISSYARRLQLLRELIRICRPGGQVLVVAWALEQGEQERKKFEKQDTMVPWHFHSRFNKSESVESKSAASTSQPKEKSETVLQRYCHVYKQGELEELLSHVEQCRVVSSHFERGNWNITIEKL